MANLAKRTLVAVCLLAFAEGQVTVALASPTPAGHYERPTTPNGPFKERVIVFVHGIFGDADETWRYSPTVYWPKLLLSDTAFNDSDIYVADYSSPYFGNTMTIDEIVNSLNSRLTVDQIFAKHREVVFVCHSLGGIIVQRLLLTFREYGSQVPFIYFFATPESGAQIAKLASMFSADPLLRAIFPGDQNTYLLSLENEWKAAHFRTRRYCAYEKKTTYGVLVVDRLSGTRNCDEPPIPINENHKGIVKPNSSSHESYVALLNAVRTNRISVYRTEQSSASQSANQPPITKPNVKQQSASEKSKGDTGPGVVNQHGDNNIAVVGNDVNVTVGPSTDKIADAVVKRIGPTVQGGFHEVVDQMDICFGSVHFLIEMGTLRKMGYASPIAINGTIPVTLRLSGDQLLFSFKSWDKNLPIELEQNEVKVGNAFVDRNFSDRAFEVVNSDGEPLFQMIRKNAGSIQINGIFATGVISQQTGKPLLDWISEDTGWETASTKPENWHLKPIFKYPSWKYQGVYSDAPTTTGAVVQQGAANINCPGGICAGHDITGNTSVTNIGSIDLRIPEDKRPAMIAVLSPKTATAAVLLCEGGNAKLAYDWYDILKAAGWSVGSGVGSTRPMKGVTIGIGAVPEDTNVKTLLDSPVGELWQAAQLAKMKVRLSAGPVSGLIVIYVGTDE